MTGMPQPGQAPWPGARRLGMAVVSLTRPPLTTALPSSKTQVVSRGRRPPGDRREILLVVHLLARVAAEVVEGGAFAS